MSEFTGPQDSGRRGLGAEGGANAGSSDEDGSQDRGAAAGSDTAGADRTGGGRADKPLPETGGTPVVLFAVGMSLVMAAAGLLALARRQSTGSG
jgi:LPXTG-motif cell wall-anchored protein